MKVQPQTLKPTGVHFSHIQDVWRWTVEAAIALPWGPSGTLAPPHFPLQDPDEGQTAFIFSLVAS